MAIEQVYNIVVNFLKILSWALILNARKMGILMSENLLLSSSDKVLDVILNGQTYFDKRGNVIKFKNEICITINHCGEIDSIYRVRAH